MRRVAEQLPGLRLIAITSYRDLAPPLPTAALLIKPFELSEIIAQLEQLHLDARSDGSPST